MKYYSCLLTCVLFQSFNLFACEVSIEVASVAGTPPPTYTFYTRADPVYKSSDEMVNAMSVAGSITGTNTIQYGTAINLVLCGFSGTILHWERKLATAEWEIITNSHSYLAEIPIKAGTWKYRTLITNGSNTSDYSPEFTLIVNPKDLTVRSCTVINKVYDQNNKAEISGATLSGVEAVDRGTIALENASSGTFSQSNAGNDITVLSSMTLTGSSASNYTLIQPILSASITPKELLITARDVSKVYGANYEFIRTNPGDFIVEGLISTDYVDGITLTSNGSPTFATLSGSPYLILPGNATGRGLNNYKINYKTGKLAISKALLVVIADNKSKIYGTANPSLTFGYYGWASGTEPITTAPNINTLVSFNSPVGSYEGAITVSGGSAENYSFCYIPGNMTVTKANQFIVFEQIPVMTFGDGSFTLSASASSGLPVLFSSSNPSVATVSGSTLKITGAGSCNISASQLGNEFYEAAETVTRAHLINTATLTIAADSVTRIYGSPNPLLTYTCFGWKNGDNESALIVQPIVQLIISGKSNVGLYNNAITISGAVCYNYRFSYQSSCFTIIPKMVTPEILAGNKNFDGTRNATISKSSLIGIQQSDEVNLLVANAEFDTDQPGKMKLVTASGLMLIGSSAKNYLLSSETAIAFAEIYEPLRPTIAGPSEACQKGSGYVYTTEGSM
jgi:MBG domain (YGX type)/YDG domain